MGAALAVDGLRWELRHAKHGILDAAVDKNEPTLKAAQIALASEEVRVAKEYSLASRLS